jgi:hypothetical protein
MDSVLQILTQYELEDPAAESPGVFNSDLPQGLYQQLTETIDASEADALVVGATVEDLDIFDIQEFMNRTDKEDVAALYENLVCGSRNHLRSFYAQIRGSGGSYSPAYITQDEFDAIVQGSNETCGR